MTVAGAPATIVVSSSKASPSRADEGASTRCTAMSGPPVAAERVDVDLDAGVAELGRLDEHVALGRPAVGHEHDPAAGVDRQHRTGQAQGRRQVGAGRVDHHGGLAELVLLLHGELEAGIAAEERHPRARPLGLVGQGLLHPPDRLGPAGSCPASRTRR